MQTLDQVNARLFDARVPWSSINRELALQNTKVLDLLRQASLIESYFPVYTSRLMAMFWDNLAATAVLTIEAMEAYGHYFVSRRYLEVVGYQPISDQEIIALRARDKDRISDDPVRELVNFMGTEHFAAEFFSDLARLTDEPVLKGILPRFSAEEVNHSNFAFDLLEEMIAGDPRVKDRVLEHALNYQHIGTYVMPVVSPAKEDNLRIIQSFNDKVGRLVGKRPSEALAERKS